MPPAVARAGAAVPSSSPVSSGRRRGARRPGARLARVPGPRRAEHRRRLRPADRAGRAAVAGVRRGQRRHIDPVFAADLLAQAAPPNRPALTPRHGGAGLEQRQPLPRGLGGHPRADDAGLLHRPVRRAAAGRRLRAAARRPRPVHRQGADRARSRAWSSRPARCRAASGCTGGSRRTSPSAATSSSPTTSRGRAAARRSRHRATSRTSPTATSPRRRSPVSRSPCPGVPVAADGELRLRHRGRDRLLPLHAVGAVRQPGRGQRRGRRVQPAVGAVRPLAGPRDGDPRPDDAAGPGRPLARRARGVLRAGRRRRGCRRWSRSTSCPPRRPSAAAGSSTRRAR